MMLEKRTTINHILRNSGLMSLTFIHNFTNIEKFIL